MNKLIMSNDHRRTVVLMRLFRLTMFVSILFGLLGTRTTAAQTGSSECGVVDDYLSGCRRFVSSNSIRNGDAFLYQFTSVVVPTEILVEPFMTGLVDSLSEQLSIIPSYNDRAAIVFGEERVTLIGESVVGGRVIDVGFVIFRLDTRIGVWGVAGPRIDPLPMLKTVLSRVAPDNENSDDDYDRVVSLLPSLEDIPRDFELDFEDFSTGLEPELDPSTPETSDARPNRGDLQATISALETQVSLTDEDEADRPRSTVPSNSDPLEILEITTRDAGIGNGSIYAYVEVVNQSGKLYPYVGLDGTCRNASGSIVGTGFGNTANVASGETVVITMIFLSARGCTDVDVRFDALTSLQ